MDVRGRTVKDPPGYRCRFRSSNDLVTVCRSVRRRTIASVGTVFAAEFHRDRVSTRRVPFFRKIVERG